MLITSNQCKWSEFFSLLVTIIDGKNFFDYIRLLSIITNIANN